MAKDNFDPVGTLSIGNVVTAGTILYKSNFKRYFHVSLRATGWGIAIFLSTIGFSFINGILLDTTKSWLFALPLSLVWIVSNLYFFAKYATDRAIICRLAYQELIDRPETITEATKKLLPRTWKFLQLSGLLGFYLTLVVIISSIAIFMVLFVWVSLFVFGLKIAPNNFTFALSTGFLSIGLLLLWTIVILRYYAYWFICELPLAIESTRSARLSLRQSKKSIVKVARRVALIMTVAFLITLPINLIGSIPLMFGRAIANPLLLPDRSTQILGNNLILAGVILSIIGELLVMPLWQAIKAIVFYDLQNRWEGRDLII